MMRAYIDHDLGAGQNLDIELLLQLVERLQPRMYISVSNLHRRAYDGPSVSQGHTPSHRSSSPCCAIDPRCGGSNGVDSYSPMCL